MAHLLGAEALHLEFPTKVVFDSVTLGLNEGDRVGIVGRNGDGKSSLLAMLAGRLQPNSGRVTVRGGVTVGVLGQADALDDTLTVEHAVVGFPLVSRFFMISSEYLPPPGSVAHLRGFAPSMLTGAGTPVLISAVSHLVQ